MRRVRFLSLGAGLALVAGLIAVAAGGSVAAPRGPAAALQRGGRLSSVARPEARGSLVRRAAPSATCMTPGATNYKADCNSTGNPTNETSIANNGSTFVAGANDYNSYNGSSDLGYYTSSDAKTWTDNGPLDIFPEGTNRAAGDPGLGVDAAGVVYYSSIYFDYVDCNAGGVELARRDPSSGSWSYYQIRANSDSEFQDKPAMMQDGSHVFVSWTRFGSCTGVGVTSPIKVAVFPTGPGSVPPIKLLSVPGSTYSQGSALASDGRGGFWVTWEEYPSSSSEIGSIQLAHYRLGSGWTGPQTISPAGFMDLPSPLPGFAFRDNSFPMIATMAGRPKVTWTSYDSGVGRAYLWSSGAVTLVSNTGGDQFFPAIGVDSAGALAISYSQTNTANASYDRYLSYGGSVTKVSTASSFPNNDPVFAGAFIGDYESITTLGTAVHPIWTDVRGPSYAQNAMVYSP